MARRLGPNPNQKFEQLKEAAAAARLPYDKDLWLNLAFYLDEQYVEWNDASRSIQRIERRGDERHRPRPVVNKIMHFVQQEHAIALQTKPAADVLPATDNPIDISESQVALAYLRWLQEPQVTNFARELSTAALWALIGGEGYLKWIYNSEKKRPDIIACSPLDIYVDPYATDFYKARYIIHSQFMDTEQVYDLYGVEVKADTQAKADPTKIALLREMGQAPVLSGVIVNELWMKPCRRYPEGLFVAWAGRETLIAARPFPYKHGGEPRLPFTQIGSIERPGTSHYSAAVKYLRSPQMELNKYHAQRIAIRETWAAPKWWVPAELDLEQLPNDAPYQVLRGQSQGGVLKPEIITPTAYPENNDGEWISEEMMHVVGLHEVSQAQVPGRVEAAKAIELLKESDAGRQATLDATVKTAIAEGFWQILMLAKQYVSEEQIVATYSREGVPEVRRFKTENWKPGLRVQVTTTTGLARSRAAREDQLMNLWEKGVIRDPEVLASLMEIPTPTVVSHKAYDIRLARAENLDLANDIAVTANSWDDHEVHIREHNNFRKTHEYLTLPSEAKSKFEHHVSMHEELQLQQLSKMAQKQQLLMAASQPPSSEQTMPGDSEGETEEPVEAAAA